MAYKRCLIATTRNLFDIPLTQGYPSNKDYGAGTKRTFTVGTYVTGFARNNYYDPENITDVNVSKDIISFKVVNASGYGIGVPLLLTAGQTYVASCVVVANDTRSGIGISYYKEDGTPISYTQVEMVASSLTVFFTIPENTYFTVISFYGQSKSSDYVFSNIQLEKGSTATSYVPYGYLPSYKKIIKVNNNPVQLLDKNQYESSLTRKGITFTNNNDGTVTVNGTATANVDFGLFGSEYNYTEKLLDGKYLILGCPSNGGENSYRIYIQGNYESSYSPTATDTGSGAFMNYSSNSYSNRKFGCWITIISGYTANNLIFKPQLYNLTAMFGEGNEPSTVAEFRAKYPNDYYDYNPSQYLVSYKKNLITDGSSKNLFNINSISFFTKDSNGEYKSNKRITESDILWKPADGTKQVTISGYIKCPVGKKYMFRIVYTDGTESYRNLESTGNYIYQAITSNSSKVVSFIGLTYYDTSDQVYLKDVQIEYGSTATSYVPYQYL